jgi:hypothetical protein
MESCYSTGRTTEIIIPTLALTCLLCFVPWRINGAEHPATAFALVDRAATQDQGAWIIDYRVRNATGRGIIVAPDEIELIVDGWVSNSRVAAHAVPRWSSAVITARVEAGAFSDVINAVDESQRCRERFAISIWDEEAGERDPGSTVSNVNSPAGPIAQPASPAPVALCLISVSPGDMLHLRLRMDHQHVLYGDYDPLLGVRTVKLTLGGSVIRDMLPLEREQYLAQPKYTWPEPPDGRRDTRHFFTAPDSLHIQADIQGRQSYRFQERPVRYNTKMKLQFWYLIAAGTEGECRVRVGQNKDTPFAWRQLHEAGFEEQLKTIGRWTKYERIIQTEPEATRIILEFKIAGEIDVGEMWIDDVSLEPLGISGPAGP